MQLVADCKRYYPWICHLCGQAIPPGQPANTELAYEADHVITVDECRKTGRLWLITSIHNLRPSHHRCNRYRNNRPFTPALIAEITAHFAPTSRPALAFFELESTEGGGVDDLPSARPEGAPAGDFSP